MSYSAFADIIREIAPMRFDKAAELSIKVGSLTAFVKALEDACGLMKATPAGVSKASFGGVEVIENDLVPPNMALIMRGDEIVNMVRFA